MTGKIKTIRGKDHYFIDGKPVTKKAFEKVFNCKGDDRPINVKKKYGHWPMKSLAMKVHTSMIGKAKERDRRNGCPPTEYTKLGEPIWTSERHKREYIKRLGVHDNNAYF